jgi:hypothetical protein
MPNFKQQKTLSFKQKEYLKSLTGGTPEMMKELKTALAYCSIAHYAANRRRNIRKLLSTGGYYDEKRAIRLQSELENILEFAYKIHKLK